MHTLRDPVQAMLRTATLRTSQLRPPLFRAPAQPAVQCTIRPLCTSPAAPASSGQEEGSGYYSNILAARERIFGAAMPSDMRPFRTLKKLKNQGFLGPKVCAGAAAASASATYCMHCA